MFHPTLLSIEFAMLCCCVIYLFDAEEMALHALMVMCALDRSLPCYDSQLGDRCQNMACKGMLWPLGKVVVTRSNGDVPVAVRPYQAVHLIAAKNIFTSASTPSTLCNRRTNDHFIMQELHLQTAGPRWQRPGWGLAGWTCPL
jgi:hypothetical protein